MVQKKKNELWSNLMILGVLGLIGLLVSCGSPEQKTKPTADFTVALDVGHTLEKHGATSARGRGEFYFNQDFTKMLHDELLKHGYRNSFIINEDGKIPSLKDRTRVAKEKGADILISLHHDSAQLKYFSKWNFEGQERKYSDTFKGHSLFYSQKSKFPDKSLKLAKMIGEEMNKLGFEPTYHHTEKIEGENRELVDSLGIHKFDDLVVLKTAEMPAVLLECGVIVNRGEELKLSNPENQKRMVRAIISAVARYRI